MYSHVPCKEIPLVDPGFGQWVRLWKKFLRFCWCSRVELHKWSKQILVKVQSPSYGPWKLLDFWLWNMHFPLFLVSFLQEEVMCQKSQESNQNVMCDMSKKSSWVWVRFIRNQLHTMSLKHNEVNPEVIYEVIQIAQKHIWIFWGVLVIIICDLKIYLIYLNLLLMSSSLFFYKSIHSPTVWLLTYNISRIIVFHMIYVFSEYNNWKCWKLHWYFVHVSHICTYSWVSSCLCESVLQF